MATMNGDQFPMVVRYGWISSSIAGEERHPQIVLEELGYKVLKYEAVGIADCSMVLIDLEPGSNASPFPSFIERSNYKM